MPIYHNLLEFYLCGIGCHDANTILSKRTNCLYYKNYLFIIQELIDVLFII